MSSTRSDAATRVGQSATVAPGTSEPGTSEPGTSEPGTSEPGTSEPASPAPATLLQGIRGALPIVVGYLPIAFSFGVAATGFGFSAGEAVLLSAVVYAGASQFLALPLLVGGDPPIGLLCDPPRDEPPSPPLWAGAPGPGGVGGGAAVLLGLGLLLAELAADGVEVALAGLDLPAGELPEPAVALVGGALADQEAAFSFDDGRDDADRYGSVRGGGRWVARVVATGARC